MEPNYVGPNGRIDAMAVAWLFANDYVFFNPGEITWDGSSHGVSGIQVNAAKMGEIPVFVDNVQQLMNGVVDLLLTLESDAGICVPRSSIHPALHDAIREGDLTALTLFNLQACAHAFQFVSSDDSTEQDMIRMCGLEAVLESPAARGETYSVVVDDRLTRGIPGFYGLVRQMFASMRAYNGIDLPFVLIFANARNFDADQCFECFDGMVDGAVSEAFHVEACGQDWKLSDQPEDESGFAIEGEGGDALDGDAEGDPERVLKLGMIRLLVSAAEVAGTAAFPEALILELERAEAGDMSIDVDDLAERINSCVPDAEAADLSNVTFDGGARADGRRFSVGVPDGWTAVSDYEESGFLGSQVRPFVLVQGEAAADDNLEMRDRVIYSALGGDMEVGEGKAAFGTDDLTWALRFSATYDRSDDSGLGSMKPVAVWDEEVEAVNTRCFVVQQQVRDEGANGLEFNIFPYANDHADFLRVVLTYEDGVTDVDHVREVVKKLASTVELDKPVICDCEKKLREALVDRVVTDDFVNMVDGFSKPYIGLRQMIYTSAQYKHVAAGGSVDDKELTIAGAEAIAGFCNRAVPVLERMIEAYAVQARLGASPSLLAEMYGALEGFSKSVFPNAEIFEGADRTVVRKARVFEPTDELKAIRERLKAVKAEVEAERRAREKVDRERRAELERELAEERERREQEAKRLEADAKNEIDAIYAELDKLDSFTPSVKPEMDAIEGEIRDLQAELSKLGLFGNGKRKKEIKAEIPLKQASLDSLKARAAEESKEHEREARIRAVELKKEIARIAKNLPDGDMKRFFGLISQIGLAKPGDVVQLGSWRKYAVDWYVIERDDEIAWLLSKKYLEARGYHDSHVPVTWQNCSLRNWLNSEFFTGCFDHIERSMIASVENDNPGNVAEGTRDQPKTVDQVFCLSLDEARRVAGRMPKVLAVEDTCVGYNRFVLSWWLRTMGRQRSDAGGYCAIRNAATVDYDGRISTSGRYVDCRGEGLFSKYDPVGVRPCIVVDLNARFD